MTTHEPSAFLTRRAALAGLGFGGLAVAASRLGVSAAQEATPAMATHPIVGTWIVHRDVTTEDEPPSIVVYTADGGLLDPSMGVGGVWQATGPRSAAWTLVVFIEQGAGGYIAVRSEGEVDEGSDTLDPDVSVTIVGPDGTVITSSRSTSHYSRLAVEPIDAEGTPLAGFPTWAPQAATPPS